MVDLLTHNNTFKIARYSSLYFASFSSFFFSCLLSSSSSTMASCSHS